MKKLVFLFLCMMFFGQLSAQNVRESGKPYLVADFNEKDLDNWLGICRKGGFEYLLERAPFSTFGHYQWNPEFAANDKAVARMVQKAEAAGIHLGLLVHPNVISENDAYFTPKYIKHFLREGPVELFSEFDGDERDIAIRYTEVVEGVSSLNLILVENELISYGTVERAGDLLLLHRCTRGAYGTRATSHPVNAEAYKIWDSPERFVVPDETLRDSVKWYLDRRIEASGITFVIRAGEPGQEMLDGSLRVRQVERWAGDEGVANLGWIHIHAANKKRDATSLDEIEWMMSKAISFDAGYGLLIDRKAMKEHGQLTEILEKIRQWESLRHSGSLTQAQRDALRDPYDDWHLEQEDDGSFALYQWKISRRFQCNFVDADSLLIGTEPWEWKADADGPFGLRLQVKGKEAIKDPMINTESGLVMFPCLIKPGQRLVYDGGEVAFIKDENYKTLREITVEGVAALPEGTSEVHLYCETEKEGAVPEVTLRYITSSQMVRYQLENYH
jgi:hypothetical protein